MLEQEAQELFLANFKKVLTGNLDAKLFELKFQRDVEYSTQTILFEGLQSDSADWQDNMVEIVTKMFAHGAYEFDTVVTFIRGNTESLPRSGIQNRKKVGMMRCIQTNLSYAALIKPIIRKSLDV